MVGGSLRHVQPYYGEVGALVRISIATADLSYISPHPAAMYWGPDLVAIYNEAFVPLAGKNHPGFTGQRYPEAWKEVWHAVKDVISNADYNAQATMKDDDCLFLERNGFLEETDFSWSMIPPIGGDGSVAGTYIPAFEKTRRKIAKRRMQSLREIGEKTGAARKVGQFWGLLLEGIKYNEYDAPLYCSIPSQRRTLIVTVLLSPQAA